MPKYYTDDWAEQFKDTARSFIKTEDMTSVHKVLIGAGYGTDNWVEVAKREAEDIASAIDQLVEEAGIGIDEETEEVAVDPSAGKSDEALENARRVLGEEIWTKLLASPQDIKAALVEEDEVIGLEDRIGDEKEEEVAEETDSAEEEDKEQIAQLQKRVEDLRKEHRDLQSEGKEKDDQIRALNEQIKKLSATLVKDEATKSPAQKFSAPSSMGAQVREYEQQLAAKEQMVSGLQGQLEREKQALEELKEDMQRERERRRKFEAELEEDR